MIKYHVSFTQEYLAIAYNQGIIKQLFGKDILNKIKEKLRLKRSKNESRD